MPKKNTEKYFECAECDFKCREYSDTICISRSILKKYVTMEPCAPKD